MDLIIWLRLHETQISMDFLNIATWINFLNKMEPWLRLAIGQTVGSMFAITCRFRYNMHCKLFLWAQAPMANIIINWEQTYVNERQVVFFFYIKTQIFKQLANCLVFREWCKYTTKIYLIIDITLIFKT